MSDDTKRHWDRDQWSQDGRTPDPNELPDELPDEPQGETWQRGQARPDLEGDPEQATRTEPDLAGADQAGDLSGGGKPAGEGDFARTEPAESG